MMAETQQATVAQIHSMLSLHRPVTAAHTSGYPAASVTTATPGVATNLPAVTSGQKRKLSSTKVSTDTAAPSNSGVSSPVDLVVAAFLEHGIDVKKDPSALQLHFPKPTQEMIEAYQMEIVKAARAGSLPELKRLHAEGNSLNCCNRFGESLLHMVCRRGDVEIVRFLVEEAHVPMLQRDDYGRTPLHDACWTSKPRFELVKYLAGKLPELLCVKDVRGHMPLDYVRKEHWGVWCKFLVDNKDLLRPKVQTQSNKRAKLT